MHVISSWTFSYTMALIWCSVLLGNHLFTPLKATDLPHRWVCGDAPVPHLTSSDVFLTARNPNLNVHQDSSQTLRKNFVIWSSLECPLEKAMAPHSSSLACRIPWMEEPGRLQSVGSLGVGHDWSDLAAAAAAAEEIVKFRNQSPNWLWLFIENKEK